MKKILPLFLLTILLTSCGLATTRPELEMSLAAAAFMAAREAKADVMSPNLYRKAEVLFLKAKSSYRKKYFNKAKEYAILSKRYAEKAEFKAIRKAAIQ
ncbi:MAG: DUF4398 domain-containing protein [Bacteriovoracia bacterium]